LPDGTTLLVDGGGRPLINQPKRQAAERPVLPPTDNDPTMVDNEESPATFARDARSIGDAVVSEYLWWRGLDHLDYMLATHAHADHMDGLNDVAHNFAVRAAFVARTPARSDEYARLAATLREARVPLYLLGRGAQLRFGEVTVDVLWPAPDASTAVPSGNDDSLVLRLRFKERVFLLTGDIENHAEAELVGAHDDLHCAVVKVGHHGSRTSSTEAFVQATHPQLAVISVGRTSPFGHPDAGVVARWQAAGAQVLQTGRRGTITISTDGRDLRVETYVPD
jgi:competence protein ComEC